MFKRMYVISFIRNIVILLSIFYVLSIYIITLVYRVPNQNREKLLSYICETGDLSYLSTPSGNFQYFYVITDSDGSVVSVSEMESHYDEKKELSDILVDVYYNGKSEFFFNTMPEDRSFHHMSINGYYFSSKCVPNGTTDGFTFHTIYNNEDLSFSFIFSEVWKAIIICLIIAVLLSIFFTFVETIPAKRAWKNQKQFIAHASHELRTPITVINSVLENISCGRTEEEQKWFGVIKNEVGMISSVVNDLMFLSRIDAKQVEANKKPVEISGILLEALITAEIMALPKEISINVSELAEAEISADETMIRQLFSILLNNAIQYTQSGGEISLLCHKSGLRVEIVIKDNGAGIDSKNMRHIFKRFYRAGKTANKSNMGLGLAIAKWIVHQHKGKIRVESEIGKGSVFIISLPILNTNLK